MQKMMKTLSVFILCQFFLISGLCHGGEEDLFSLMVDPDALIALDLSGSMDRPPTGDYGFSNAVTNGVCSGDKVYFKETGIYNKPCANEWHLYGATDACTEPFYSGSSGRVDCRKKIIAKQAIYTLLDADGSGGDKKYDKKKIDKNDEKLLGVRMGYMRFTCCEHAFTVSSHDSYYNGGCNLLKQGFKKVNDPALPDGYYRSIYTDVETDTSTPCPSYVHYSRTPLAGMLSEAKDYLDYTKDPIRDALSACRKKFVIFITDGWDTLGCGAEPGTSHTGYSYKRRTATIAAAKALNDAGYKVFVIGFGLEMPKTLANTLNWAAYFGGTDNPDEVNKQNGVVITGKPTSPPTITVDSACNNVAACDNFNPDSIGYPGGCTGLGNDIGANCCSGPNPDCCTLAPNDPGFKNLSGYAFFANDATALKSALTKAMEYIKEARYSFTVSSVSAARISSENSLYEASFIPLESDPFWLGHLKKYDIDDYGKVIIPARWDAGDKLMERTAASRNMWTYLSGGIKAFNTTNITPTLLELSSTDTAGRDAVVGYFRGDPTYNLDTWKLGDIFHANPITIASPPVFYNDFRSPAAYVNHRNNNGARERLVVMGANDGQFHAFSSTGEEKWSFIPPNLLPKLKLVAHSTETSPLPSHQFFVDGPVTVTEAWLGSGDGLNNKVAGDWRTLLIFGLGKGVRESHPDVQPKVQPTYLWSASPSCDSDFKKKYNPPHQYYCGYYAFDVTDTSLTQPVYKWRINVAGLSQGKVLDEPWSKMVTGRVWIDGNEKWVGFIGAGYNHTLNADYTDDTPETRGMRGKGFFVIDLSNGNILWSYTKDNDSNMDYPIPASPAVVDWDSDGFVDTAYLADLGGNMWRFRFCSFEDYRNNQPCNTGDWKGGRLFGSTTGNVRPVFTRPGVASDASNQLWVFWGTGNKLSPTDTGSQERFFALQDTFVPAKSGTTPPSYVISNLQDISSTTYAGVQPGWYVVLPGGGEKNLSDSAVFGGMVLFTTYTPPPVGTESCSSAGTGRLYAMAMMPIAINGVLYKPGAGLWAGGERSIYLGTGVPTAPVISQKPRDKSGPTDVFVSLSGGGGTETMVKSTADLPIVNCPACARLAQTTPQAQITHWRDKRLQ